MCGENHTLVCRNRRKRRRMRDWRGIAAINMINIIVFPVHKIFCANITLGERHCYFNFELLIVVIVCWL